MTMISPTKRLAAAFLALVAAPYSHAAIINTFASVDEISESPRVSFFQSPSLFELRFDDLIFTDDLGHSVSQSFPQFDPTRGTLESVEIVITAGLQLGGVDSTRRSGEFVAPQRPIISVAGPQLAIADGTQFFQNVAASYFLPAARLVFDVDLDATADRDPAFKFNDSCERQVLLTPIIGQIIGEDAVCQTDILTKPFPSEIVPRDTTFLTGLDIMPYIGFGTFDVTATQSGQLVTRFNENDFGAFGEVTFRNGQLLMTHDIRVNYIFTPSVVTPPSPTPVPEPTTLALISLGLAGLGFARKRRLHS